MVLIRPKPRVHGGAVGPPQLNHEAVKAIAHPFDDELGEDQGVGAFNFRGCSFLGDFFSSVARAETSDRKHQSPGSTRKHRTPIRT